MVLFGQNVCIWANWLYLCKLVVFGEKWLNLGKMVVFGQIGSIRTKSGSI